MLLNWLSGYKQLPDEIELQPAWGVTSYKVIAIHMYEAEMKTGRAFSFRDWLKSIR